MSSWGAGIPTSPAPRQAMLSTAGGDRAAPSEPHGTHTHIVFTCLQATKLRAARRIGALGAPSPAEALPPPQKRIVAVFTIWVVRRSAASMQPAGLTLWALLLLLPIAARAQDLLALKQ